MPYLTQAIELRSAVELCFDDRSRLKIRKKDFSALSLQNGDDVDLNALTRTLFENQMAEGYESALSLLDYSARTESEIRRKLSEKGFIPLTIDYVTDKLKNARLLDDRAIAERIAEGAISRGMGAYQLKRKLRARGLSEEDCEYAASLMDEDSEKEGCVREAARLLKKYASLDQRQARAKLSQALARRGYSWDAVAEAVESALSDDGFDDL